MSAVRGTGQLVRLHLRRNRVFLPVWLGSLLALIVAQAVGVEVAYNTPRAIAAYAANLGSSPATIAMSGPPVALDTFDGILLYETGLPALIGIALLAIFLGVRHTRGEEDAGRTELLLSTATGRYAVLASAVATGIGACLIVGMGTAATLLAEDMPAYPALVFSASVVALGVAFTAVAVCAAQVMSSARGAVGLSLSMLGVSYVLRALGDARGWWTTWASPIGWSQQVLAPAENRLWPLLLSAGLVVVLLALAAVLVAHRDLGSGVVAPRPGPARASASLGSPLGLAWRLQRATVLSWVVGLFAFGLMFGSVSEEIQSMVQENPALEDYFAQAGGSAGDAYFVVILLILGVMASGFAVASALRMRAEEHAGRSDHVLAAAVSRMQLASADLTVTLAGSVLVVAAAGLGVGIASAAVTSDASAVLRLTVEAFAYLPSVLVLAGLAMLLVGWVPRLSALAWLALAGVFVIAWLGDLLQLPEWVVRLSPFSHVPAVPVERWTVAPSATLAVVAVALAAAGAAGFRRRDLG